MRSIRIFVSSPGDVDHERRRVEQVAQRLHGEFAQLVDLQTIRWETGFYKAHETFQTQIPEAADCDLVIAIFGTRLGSELPDDFPRRMTNGEPYPSGTAYEVLTAIEARRTNKTPDVYVFRKTVKPVAVVDDPQELETVRRQWERLKAFFEHWFQSAQGQFRAAFQTFATTDQFGEQIEALLREWLEQNVLKGARAVTWPIEINGSPFRSLEPYDAKHATVFFGRKRDTARAIDKLTEAAGRGTPFLLVIGSSGVGKSSFARAGIAPRLTTPGVVADVDVWRVATMRPGGTDAFLSLAAALFGEPGETTALPEIGEGDSATADELAVVLRGTETAALRPVMRAIDRVAERERTRGSFQREVNVALLLIVDQLDELFGQGEAEDRARFAKLIAALVATRKVWVVATLRADLYERFLAEPTLVALKSAGAVYDLAPLGPAELAETVREPAKAAGLMFDADPKTDEALDERLIRDAGSGEALPLLQFTLQRLFEARVKKDDDTVVLTGAAYAEMGGIDGAVDGAAETALRGLDENTVAALPLLLRHLARLARDPAASGGTTLQIQPVDGAIVQKNPALAKLVEALVAARILSVSQERNTTVYRLAHQRVLQSWNRARDSVQGDSEFFRIRDEVGDALRRWNASGQRPEFLLAKGVPLEEAEKIAQRYRGELSAETLDYIAVSGRRARRRQRLTEAAAAVFALVAVVAVVLGVLAYLGGQRADRERLRAEHERTRAETEKDRADQALQRALLAQSRSLADLSQVRLLEGDAATAVNLALEALGNDERGVPRPYMREAAAALMSAISALAERAVLGHSGAVRGAAFSPDGSRVATASADGTARLWDSRSGALLATLKHGGPLDRAVFSPDGRLLATASFDKTVRLWDAASGKLLRTLAHKNGVTRIEFSRDGRKLVTGAIDAAAHVWDVESGKELHTLKVPQVWVSELAVSPDGRRVVTATASFEDFARVWDAESGQQLFELAGHKGTLKGVAFSPDGTLILTWSQDNTARLWDAATGSPRGRLEGHAGAVFGAAFSPDGERIATASMDGTARIWEAASGKELVTLTGHHAGVVHVAFSHDGSLVATASEDRTARVWNAQTGQLAGVRGGHQGAVRFVGFAPDDKTLVTGADDSTARLWRVDDNAAVRAVQQSGPAVWQARFSPDGKRVATATGPAGAIVQDVESGKEVLRLGAKAVSLAYSPDGRQIATGSTDGSVTLWDATNGAEIRKFAAHTQVVWMVAFDPAGKRLATASRDATAVIWDLESGAKLHTLSGPPADIWSASFSPDGKLLVTAGHDDIARVWDTTTGALVAKLAGHRIAIRAAVFDRTGQRIATAGWDNTARIWDVASAKTLVELTGATAYLTDIAFSPDGRNVIATSYDRTLRVWDAESGQTLLSLTGHKDGMHSLALSPDGKLAVTTSLDGSALMWRLFPSVADTVDYAHTRLPRCLTPEERRSRFLASDPPDWCTAQAKWPYRVGEAPQ